MGRRRILDDDWRREIRAAVADGVPLLGICLGLQWLFEGSEEAPLPGLGALAGQCARLPAVVKVPHVGWNSLDVTRPSPLLEGVSNGTQVYFTHSFAAPVTADCVAATTHGATFAAAVQRDNVWGVQFHPEKSGPPGLRDPAELHAHDSGTLNLEPGTRNPEPKKTVLSKRIIACLDVRDGSVVKGINFEGLRRAGDPAELAERYNAEGIDELVILDVTATIEGRRALADTIRQVSSRLFIPLAVGGGIRAEGDAAAAIDAGADKVSINSAALADPALVTTLAERYGSQAVVVAIDAKQNGDRFDVFARSGKVPANRDAVEWAIEAESRGAGEILLTSIDRDGTRSGFDCELTSAVSKAVSIPVIASGGAGTFDHFFDVFTGGKADAALAASIFHYSEHAVSDLKSFLNERGVPMRLAGI